MPQNNSRSRVSLRRMITVGVWIPLLLTGCANSTATSQATKTALQHAADQIPAAYVAECERATKILPGPMGAGAAERKIGHDHPALNDCADRHHGLISYLRDAMSLITK